MENINEHIQLLSKEKARDLTDICKDDTLFYDFLEKLWHDYTVKTRQDFVVHLLKSFAKLLSGSSDFSFDTRKRLFDFGDLIVPRLTKDLSPSSIKLIIYLLQETDVLSRSKFENVLLLGDYLNTGVQLGKGCYAEVFKGVHIRTYNLCAIKKLALTNTDATLIQREVSALRIPDHRNIVNLRDEYMVPNAWKYKYLILEYCNGGDLEQFLSSSGHLTEETVRSICRQLVDGLFHLQNLRIVHRDLKPANILIHYPDETDLTKIVAKIADFTFARFIQKDEMMYSQLGTPLYMAPEVINGHYSDNTDLWSLGLIFYQLFFKKFPFSLEQFSIPALWRAIHSKLVIPEGISPEANDLLKRLIQTDPTQRISWKDLLGHPFLAMKDGQLLEDELETLQRELVQSQQTIIELQNQINEIKFLKENITRLETEDTDLQNQIQEKKKMIDNLYSTIASQK